MADVQIRPATPAPAVIANSRDTRVAGVHPTERHHTNGAGVQIGGGPNAYVRSTMGAAGAKVAAPTGLPTGTPKAQTGAVVQPAAKATAKTAAPTSQLIPAEAALALDIIEGEVSRAIIANVVPAPMLELAKSVVKKLRAQAGIPESVPLPWDLAPPAISPPAPVTVPDPVPVPVPESASSPSNGSAKAE